MTGFCPFQCTDGFAAVNDEYVAAQMAKLPAEVPEEAAAYWRSLFRASVYPCPHCRPEQYELWAAGHLASGHTCEDCEARRRKRRPSTRATAGARS